MRTTVAAIIGLILSTLCAAAEPLVFPADLRAALKESTAFQTRTSTTAIPGAVRASFIKSTGQKSFSMAEPGAAWQSTDVVSNRELPDRRLVNVALSSPFCIVFYEIGGIARSYRVAVFRLSQNDAKLVWSGYSSQIIADPKTLLNAVEKDQVHAYPSL